MSNFGRPAGPLSNCQSSPNIDRVSKFRLRAGPLRYQSFGHGEAPLCQILKKKVVTLITRVKVGRAQVSNFGAPRGPCQSSSRAGAPCVKFCPLCQSVKFCPAPGPLLSRPNRAAPDRISVLSRPSGLTQCGGILQSSAPLCGI